ncbi:MAG: hypothetical protein HY908_16900 [Myxococcales bacterium]|nr:hypothetical protein [Myxococcales bacterium]
MKRTRKSTAGDRPASGGTVSGVAPAQASSPAERRLESVLRSLPAEELAGLMERMGVRVDAQKRIDAPAQAARALVRLPEIREPSRLPAASEELLRRVAEAGGSLVVDALPTGVELLVRRGLLFARILGDSVELVLPTAFVVQLRGWDGEDPRSLRALLSEAPFETASAIASHYLGRPSTPPLALSLEAAWEVLGDPEVLRLELDRIAHQERRLLEAVEQVGGEVDTQELMELEREPMRVRGVYGIAAGRRGAAFSLEKRGLLFPLHPNRYVIPTEVAVLVGEARRSEQEQRRRTIRSAVLAEDHLPRRARFSTPVAPFALGLALAVRELSAELRPGVGTPRSLVARLAQRFGRDVESTALVGALSRAVGLWEPAGIARATPPGSLELRELAQVLFDTWRRGGAWDEARSDAETLRVAADHRDPSPATAVREMVLGALRDLGEGLWVPCSAFESYLAADGRVAALERLFARWAQRTGQPLPAVQQVARRVLLESLPALGVVDVGDEEVGSRTATGSGAFAAASTDALSVRLTGRGRALLAAVPLETPPFVAEFTGGRTLAVGEGARCYQVLDLCAFSDVGAVGTTLELCFAAPAVSRGLAAGVEASAMRERIAALAPLAAELAEALTQAGEVVGRATLVGASGFLWVDDPEVRELLRTRQPTAELFVDPSPPAGLLLGHGVDLERLVRRCRALGVEVQLEEGRQRARPASMPPPKRSETNRRVSWRPSDIRNNRSRS